MIGLFTEEGTILGAEDGTEEGTAFS